MEIQTDEDVRDWEDDVCDCCFGERWIHQAEVSWPCPACTTVEERVQMLESKAKTNSEVEQ